MKEILIQSSLPNIFGYRYLFSSEKGVISCVSPCSSTKNYYEIFVIEGDLFEDIERYDTLDEAESRIKELLVIEPITLLKRRD
jgi:hypothetical protein